ncbi:TPA: acyl-CoA dehydrogenase family protein [Pseudomonas aeruginosa]|uniref:Acyl-[acyl-carrier-protein] dehydrogenase MbtN n=1 Tax=Pseudomonas plecoglossicida TaxID=70775 RepID=A0ABX4U3Q7_PSEDL|nr:MULTISPECIES: acyl-CoA dehydrogenase family protein [Pseudomonas]AZN49984.1 acyl-CoA dehydrogenase [Pseudomonas aeruginosa]EKU2896456.1 acyl-CoA dehydrogenase family protein [Pseudomonas aeruginosa]EKX9245206.1 acyl-CoA dehydrogenase family protein [Pseudomonas aeruginosa]ELB6583878.1 acyl-CoA dehydrogenase family protein [Pseudomonas aeruginosa]ELK4933840.1 acyl-CoA dehydrogenase family protein [Pseudomonas aeruginosa]
MLASRSDWRSERRAYEETHGIFREQVRRFYTDEMQQHGERWEREGVTDRAFWQRAGAQGLLSPQVPECYGGAGLDVSYNFIVTEELAWHAAPNGFQTHSDVAIEYLLHYGSEALKQRWLPGTVDGSCISAIAMTEPGAGSDLRAMKTTARRDGDHFIVNGSKTYISNGQNADIVVTAVRTDSDSGALSLLLIEADREGFQRGRNLDKIGQHSADTSELFFQDVRVPVSNLIGEEGRGLQMLIMQLPQERLSIALAAQAGAQRAFDEALRFTGERQIFGKRVLDFQNSRFSLADISAKLQVGWAHIDWAISRHLADQLSAEEAAAAKLWHAETLWQVVDCALQLHGGAGYMNEYLIARLWRDARVMRIFGGTSEVMKEIIGRAL